MLWELEELMPAGLDLSKSNVHTVSMRCFAFRKKSISSKLSIRTQNSSEPDSAVLDLFFSFWKTNEIFHNLFSAKMHRPSIEGKQYLRFQVVLSVVFC